MASSKTSLGEHWRTKARQPECYQDDDRWRLRIYVAKRKGDKSKLWNRVYSCDWKPDGWATEAAAMAARAAFKHWVDYERNLQQRQAQSASVASRSSAALNVLLQTPEPTRVSGRKRPRDARVAVSLIAVGGKVQLGMAVAELMPDGSPGPEELIQYHQRSAGMLQRARKRRKREIEMRSGLHAVSCESEVLWSDIIARCQAEAARRDSCFPLVLLTCPNSATAAWLTKVFLPTGVNPWPQGGL
jgi:hypothetical protein